MRLLLVRWWFVSLWLIGLVGYCCLLALWFNGVCFLFCSLWQIGVWFAWFDFMVFCVLHRLAVRLLCAVCVDYCLGWFLLLIVLCFGLRVC